VLGLTAEEQPFDKWLRMQLHAMFDGVINEPLTDLVRLIDEDAKRVRQETDEAAAPKPPPEET